MIAGLLLRFFAYPTVLVLGGLWLDPKASVSRGVGAGLVRVLLGAVVGIPIGLASANSMDAVAFAIMFWFFRFVLWLGVVWGFYSEATWPKRLTVVGFGLLINLLQDFVITDGGGNVQDVFSLRMC